MAATTLLASVLLVSLFLPAARAAPGLQFLDDRPVVIDLDTLPDTPRWRVQVFQGQPGGPRRLELRVLFDPAGTVSVENPVVDSVPTGATASFVIALADIEPGSGQLVVTSDDGNVARRAIRTARLQGEAGQLPSELHFSGTSLTPLGGPVQVGGIHADDAPGFAVPPVRLGTIVSEGGDLADVVREGDTFDVTGVDGPGEYTGTVDVLPGADGARSR